MKKFLKKVLAIYIVISCCNLVFAGKIPEVNTNYKNPVSFEEYYSRFIGALISKKNITEEDMNNPGRIYLSERSNSLIIGCSPVTYAYIYASPLVRNYKYDLVGFGATTDEKLLNWLKILDKKYNKVVIWGQVNDIFEAMHLNKGLDDTFYDRLLEIFVEAKEHLRKGPDSKIVFINIREMTDEDGLTEEETEAFNIEARKVNDYVRSINIPSVNIKSTTDTENSQWYLHYTNPDVFNFIFRDIECLGEVS